MYRYLSLPHGEKTEAFARNQAMSSSLSIDYAASTSAGSKAENADAADARVPKGGALLTKGIAAAIADGMSSSEGGKLASEICISSFLSDYYSTPDSWTVKTSASKVLGAANKWLYAQGQSRFDSARGMVTTFSGLVIKSTTAHVFHVGDSRIYQYRDGELEQLTRDHRVWVSSDREFLSRAMGIDPHLDIDYTARSVEPGDIFLFTTDGISSFLSDNRLRQLLDLHAGSLQSCCNVMLEEALHNGSNDNVTCQLVRVIDVPTQTEDDILQQITELPFPPDLAAGIQIDDYQIVRELHASKRSEVFLARNIPTGTQVILKTPSVNYRDDPAYLEGFLHEEWVGRRIASPHVLKILDTPRRRFLYNIAEYVPGQSLRQWMNDHPQTHINTARAYLAQIAEGLRAFHRLEMIHLDLKPENILIDPEGTLKIIDFGSTRVAGSVEIASSFTGDIPQGTVNYAAPECVQGQASSRSDLFSLGVIAYELLTGALPYGDHDHPRPAHKLRYVPAHERNNHIQPWVDRALEKAVHPNPRLRYEAISEFLYDLSHPNAALTSNQGKPLAERHPLAFWKVLAGISIMLNLALLVLLAR